MIVYKINVLERLKDAGYNTARLRREHMLGENAIQYLRDDKMVGANRENFQTMITSMGCSFDLQRPTIFWKAGRFLAFRPEIPLS